MKIFCSGLTRGSCFTGRVDPGFARILTGSRVSSTGFHPIFGPGLLQNCSKMCARVNTLSCSLSLHVWNQTFRLVEKTPTFSSAWGYWGMLRCWEMLRTVCHGMITFHFIFSVRITYYGTEQCLWEDGTGKWEVASAEIDCGPVDIAISDWAWPRVPLVKNSLEPVGISIRYLS